jgi:excisionase family DNA binding protein
MISVWCRRGGYEMDDAPRLYTVHEIARILRMHEETVRILLRSGRLKGIKLGPHATLPGRFEWRITDQALRQFLESGAEPTSGNGADASPDAGETER